MKMLCHSFQQGNEIALIVEIDILSLAILDRNQSHRTEVEQPNYEWKLSLQFED